MKELNELFNEIDKVEKELKRNQRVKIDYSSPNWEEKLKAASTLNPDTEARLKNLLNSIISAVRNANQEKIDNIREKLSSTKNVICEMGISFDELKKSKNAEKFFEDEFLLKAISGPGPDIRDTMLSIAELVKIAKEKSIDYKKIIKGVLKYASDEQVLSYGSMKSLLENYLKR